MIVRQADGILERARGVPALLYHHVGNPRAGTNWRLTIATEVFRQQMQWLSNHGYTGIRPSDWLAWRNEGRMMPAKPIIITFDDGYADVALNALPVLERYGFGAAVFVVTRALGGRSRWDIEAGRASASFELMTSKQIQHWSARGIEFGAHSRTHADLRALDMADLDDEVRGSAEDLTLVLGERPRSFAYPFGHYDSRVSSFTREVFPIAFTCDEDGLNYRDTDTSKLRRVTILPHESLMEFALRVRLGWTPVEWMRRAIGERGLRRLARRWVRRITP
jgi:peptidoglycan/xylan/chitin deacetylase (PgdA/CDA1 family)